MVYKDVEKIIGSTNLPTSAISDYSNAYLIGYESIQEGKTLWVYFERYNGAYLFDFVDYSETVTLAKAILYAR